MPTTAQRSHNRPQRGAPAWELVKHFPAQGEWDELDYLSLDPLLEDARSIELVDGRLEFLPMPTKTHELIVAFIYEALRAFMRGKNLGEVFFSGRRVKLGIQKIRVPDIVFLLKEHRNRSEEDFSLGADLAIEVVSRGREDHERDYVRKRRDYAKAGIAEYWIVDPQQEQITVLNLQGGKYSVHGKFKKGQRAASFLLLGFEVDVTEALAGLKQ